LWSTSALATPPLGAPLVDKDDVRITLLPAVAPAGPSEAVKVGALDIEARTPEAATRIGSPPGRGPGGIACGPASHPFARVAHHPDPNLAGDGQARKVSGAWIHPAPDSVMLDVVQRICAGGASAARPPAVVAMAEPTPSPAPTQTAAPAPAAVVAPPTPAPT